MSDATGLRAFVEALAAAGVREAVVCPGSRSTPLALALRVATGIRVRVLYDERAAAFFALGMARTARRPVVLLATSGTAVRMADLTRPLRLWASRRVIIGSACTWRST